MSDSPKDISDLCVSCGMCCDGTLFGRAHVRDEADKTLVEEGGLSTFESGGKFYFRMPCIHFSGCCTIYGRQRPHVCAAFFCQPLKKIDLGQQTYDEAREQVYLLRDHRDKLLKAASQFPELADLPFGKLKATLENLADDQEKVSQYRHLFLFLVIFEDLREKYFQVVRKDESLAS